MQPKDLRYITCRTHIILLAVVDERYPGLLLDQLGGVRGMASMCLRNAVDDIVDGQFRRTERHRVRQDGRYNRGRCADLRTVGHGCDSGGQTGIVVVIIDTIVVVVVIIV